MIKGIALFLILFSPYSFAQGPDTLNWFPHKPGDMWEYWVDDGITVDTGQTFNIKDSLSAEGKIHLLQYRRLINPMVHDPYLDSLRYEVDSTILEVSGPLPVNPSKNVVLFRFNVERGEQWVMEAHEGGGYELARVKEIYQGMIFDRNTTFIQMHYYGAADSTDTLGLSREVTTLAKGFGVVERFFSEGGVSHSIKGAVIDGVLYGDTTRILTSVTDDQTVAFPGGFALHQNYPNPFNPSTTISFEIKTSGTVSLVVYDVIGRQAKRLIDNERPAPGTHEVAWDGEMDSGQRAPSGIYFYRLLSDNIIITRSMILLK